MYSGGISTDPTTFYNMKIPGIILLFSLSLQAQINSQSTETTVILYQNLKKLQGKEILFGHQDALAYGLNKDGSRWIGEKDRSDVKSVSGQHPAVIGYDLGYLELDSARSLDKVPFSDIKESIIATYKRGGLNTISWHPNNPLAPQKNTWAKEENTIRRILNDSENLKRYNLWLDKLASFFLDLKDAEGKLVPVIFRPFHEHTGSWFWWGEEHCTPEEYILFWKHSMDYLLKEKGVNNILIGYSTDVFRDKAHYLERYPGNDYVDILGFDTYHKNAPETNKKFTSELKRMITTLNELSAENGKPYAVTEMGLEQITVKDWWSSVVLPGIENSGISYFLVWRNGYDKHYYAPYPGQQSTKDFLKLVKTKKVLLEKGVKKRKIYHTR